MSHNGEPKIGRRPAGQRKPLPKAKVQGKLPPRRRPSSVEREKVEIDEMNEEEFEIQKTKLQNESRRKRPKQKNKTTVLEYNPGIIGPVEKCKTPTKDPNLPSPPTRTKPRELGMPDLNEEDLALSMVPAAGRVPPYGLPQIYLGDSSPAPRWLIRPVQPVPEPSSSSSSSSASSGSKPPPLGRLRWEFDPGPGAQHGENAARLRGYAYQYLLNSLSDPVVRDEMRELIWNGPYSKYVEHVEDPLPIPPPPAYIKDKKKLLDSVDLMPPISASAPDEYLYMYPDYKRPSLAARVARSPVETPSSSRTATESSSATPSPNGDSSGTTRLDINSHVSEANRPRPRASTSSSSSTSGGPKNYASDIAPFHDEEGQHFQPGESKHRWIWILLTVLILSMFLCLFLYAFGILR
ncbi:hypothetical protein BJX61DRAFT_367844 [Aspergillus egyptiacus]|nr:hypothetical protein BJX61DRAFT_367844 [Aspergillus egyptiacus]